MRTKHPYQLALIAGAAPESVADVADSTVVITPGQDGTLAERVIEGLRASGVTPADLRARTLFVSSLPVNETLAVYAAVSGFAGRHVDTATANGIASIERITKAGREIVDSGKPDRRFDAVIVGDAEALEAVTEEISAALTAKNDGEPVLATVAAIDILNGSDLSEGDASALRWSKRVRMAPTDSLDTAMTRFSYLAGVRWRRGQERFPSLLDGTDLDGIRQDAGALRRSMRAAGTEVAEKVEATARQQRLDEAATVHIDQVLAALGSVTDGKLWQCPRPRRHTHGDATPSLRVEDNKVCCYVDDAEWVDPLRLVMSALALGPDDAAAMLEDLGQVGWGTAAKRIIAERAAKAAR